MKLAFGFLVRQNTTPRAAQCAPVRSLQAAIVIVLLSTAATAYAGKEGREDESPSAIEGSLYLKVKPGRQLKMSALGPGDILQGTIAQDVYSGERRVFPAGSAIRLTVDKLERRRRVPNDRWPWVVKFFTPRHETYPTFQTAVGVLPDGSQVPLRVSLISIGREVEIRSSVQAKADQSKETRSVASIALATPKSSGKTTGPTIKLRATDANPKVDATPILPSNAPAFDAGTQARVILLEGVSASRSRRGDLVQARIVEPVWSGSTVVLPEGSLLEGRVVRSIPPRTLSRPGSLSLAFTTLKLPGGTSQHIAASIAGVEADHRSHIRVDPEGQIHGGRPGKAWMLINVGATAGIAKEVDDGAQLLIEALVSTATDASTAGTARLASTCVSGLFMLTRHGRDVVLPKFTELRITFDRPVPLPEAPAQGSEISTASGSNPQ